MAVIDEDADNGFQNRQGIAWENFREEYPNRRFCLLRVERGDGAIVGSDNGLPSSFTNDPKVTINDVKREVDSNNEGNPTGGIVSWVDKCGLREYLEKSNIEFVALFVDDSGSMYEKEVQGSLDKFYEEIEVDLGLEVRKVVNSDENWIKPFMDDLVPTGG